MSEGELKKRLEKLLSPEIRRWNPEVLGLVDEARKDFPIRFEWQVMIGEKEDGNGIFETQVMPNARLPENRANSRIDKDKVIDWFLKWFGNQ